MVVGSRDVMAGATALPWHRSRLEKQAVRFSPEPGAFRRPGESRRAAGRPWPLRSSAAPHDNCCGWWKGS